MRIRFLLLQRVRVLQWSARMRSLPPLQRQVSFHTRDGDEDTFRHRSVSYSHVHLLCVYVWT